MSNPPLNKNSSRRELRKAVLRMRLEMHRQEIRHESMQLLAPLKQAKALGASFKPGKSSLWLIGGSAVAAGLLGSKFSWRRWLRMAVIAAPLLREVLRRSDKPADKS